MEAAMYPSREQLKLLERFAPSEAIWMISIQRFRKNARYADGSDDHLSGREAYARYAAGLRPLVEAAGGRVVAIGELRGLFIGTGAMDYDMLTILEFPDRRSWLDMMASDAAKAISHHREAGLESQLLLLGCARDAI